MRNIYSTYFIDVGITDDAMMVNPDDLTWMSVLNNNFWWSQTLTGIRFRKQQTDTIDYEESLDWAEEYALPSETTGFTDSGTSCAIFPEAISNFIIEALLDTLLSY